MTTFPDGVTLADVLGLDTPPSKWFAEGKEDPHSSDHIGKYRKDLCMGHLTDDELANAQYLCDRKSLDLIAYQTASKERIRWLSRQYTFTNIRNMSLAYQNVRLRKKNEDLRQALGVVLEHIQTSINSKEVGSEDMVMRGLHGLLSRALKDALDA